MSSSHGGFAAIVWVVAGLFLFYSEPEAMVLSWQFIAYFFVGMFAAAFVLGNLSLLTVRGLTAALVKMKIVTRPTRRAAIGLAIAGYFIFGAQAVLTYFVARFTVRSIF